MEVNTNGAVGVSVSAATELVTEPLAFVTTTE